MPRRPRIARRGGVNLRLRILIPMAVVVTGILAGMCAVIAGFLHDRIEDEFRSVLMAADRAVDHRLSADTARMTAALFMLATDELLQADWERGDRDALLARAEAAFKALREQSGVTRFYFHAPDRTCVLRVHRPDRHGDLITRRSLARAAETGELASGVEMGPLGTLTLRVVLPWRIGGRLTGYLELGVETDNLCRSASAVDEMDVQILLLKDRVDRQAWTAGSDAGAAGLPWDTLDRFVIAGSSCESHAREYLDFIDDQGSDLVGSTMEYDGDSGTREVGFLGLRDIDGRPVGVIAIDHDSSRAHSRLRTEILILIAGKVALLLGLGLVSYILLRRLERLQAHTRIQEERTHRRHLREIRHGQSRAEASEARYRGLFDGTSDAVMLLDGQKFVECNDATLRLFDCGDPGEFLTKHPSELSPPTQRDGTDSREAADEKIGIALREGSSQFDWLHMRADGTVFDAEVLLCTLDLNGRRLLQAVVRDIGERKRAEDALGDSERNLRAIAEAAQDAIVQIDGRGRVQFWNPAAATIFGRSAHEMIGRDVHSILAPDRTRDEARAKFAVFAETGHGGAVGQTVELMALRKDGREFPVELSLASLKTDEGWQAVAVIRDITERRALEQGLVHAQKMESIGHLAAGIAHEINTPTQFVGDNLQFLSESFADLAKLGAAQDRLLEAALAEEIPTGLASEVATARDEADVAYLLEEIPAAIAQSLDGLERTTTIVCALKEFSHPDSREKAPADLNRAIESTVTMARNEWKYHANLVTDLDPRLPLVTCWIGDMNQVVLNLVVNAAHAIAEALAGSDVEKGTITVSTHGDADRVEIRIADTGTGIPEEVRTRVFDPFFTTKEVGKGTGQGLSLAYDVIVRKHGGTLTFETDEGRGTTFIIRLPGRTDAQDDGEVQATPSAEDKSGSRPAPTGCISEF
jgi:PAS domain S-box-containing protein